MEIFCRCPDEGWVREHGHTREYTLENDCFTIVGVDAEREGIPHPWKATPSDPSSKKNSIRPASGLRGWETSRFSLKTKFLPCSASSLLTTLPAGLYVFLISLCSFIWWVSFQCTSEHTIRGFWQRLSWREFDRLLEFFFSWRSVHYLEFVNDTLASGALLVIKNYYMHSLFAIPHHLPLESHLTRSYQTARRGIHPIQWRILVSFSMSKFQGICPEMLHQWRLPKPLCTKALGVWITATRPPRLPAFPKFYGVS